MKCPMMACIDYDNEGKPVPITEECLKEECAWWDDLPHRCAVLSVAAKLTSIEGNIRGGPKHD